VTDHAYHEDEVLGKAYDARLMRRLLTYLRPHRKVVVISVVLLIGSALLELAGPLIVKIAIDRYVSTKDVGGIWRMAFVYLGTLTAAFFLGYAQIYIMQRMGQRVMLTLRQEIFTKLTTLHVQYFDRNPVGRLITRLTSDVDALNEMFTSGVVAIFGDVITLLGIMGILIALNLKLALVTFAVLPLLFLVSRWFRKNARESYRQVRLRIARINSYLQEAITGMAVLQIMNREERSRREFDALNRSHTEAHLRSIFYYATFYPAVELLASVAVAGVIWIGGGELLAGTFTLGGLVAFLQYVRRFYQPIQDLSEKYNILQGAMASSERIFHVLDTEPAVADPPRPAVPGSPERGAAIEFDHVWFAYSDEDWVLQDVSFRVDPGESVAFVGATGSGKTTMMNLLLRFYDVQRGAVRVDGVDVREWDQSRLRRKMSLVLQDVFLFSGSVHENIRLGRENLTDAAVERAVRLVNAADFVERLPEGYRTEVGERGSSLSTGQKQLLSFARALVHEPEVLILDEATSNVDTETEVLIQDALHRMMQGRTSLVVAHRLSTVRNADRIIVLHKGRIREEGPHQALLARRGIYYRLYLLQYKDQEAPVEGEPLPDRIEAQPDR
jgi:ATP-binding cassette subfamily B protein